MTDPILSQAELLHKIRQGWQDFSTFIASFTDEELTSSTDAAGWTAKDHIIHMAVWEDGIFALLEKLPRHVQMGLDAAMWSKEVDEINDYIWKQHRDIPLADVKQTFTNVHQRLIDKVETLSDDDLARPYSYYQPDSVRSEPVIGWIIADTYEHYAEHKPWIAAIIGRK